MSAFEVKGEGNVGSQRRLWERDIIPGRKLHGAFNNLVQELRLADARFHTTSAPKLIGSVNLLLFSCCFCCYGNDSPLPCHWSAVKKALDVGRFFLRKVELFSTCKKGWTTHLHSLPLKKSEAAIVPIGRGHIALIWDQSLRSSELGTRVCAVESEVEPRPAHTPAESIASTHHWPFFKLACTAPIFVCWLPYKRRVLK